MFGAATHVAWPTTGQPSVGQGARSRWQCQARPAPRASITETGGNLCLLTHELQETYFPDVGVARRFCDQRHLEQPAFNRNRNDPD